MPTRRSILQNAIKLAPGFAITPGLRSLTAMPPVISLRRGPGAAVSLPKNFMGLGYEMSSVATPGLLSETNVRYVNLVKGLGSEGVIRAGGIVADYTRYDPAGSAVAEPKNTVITRSQLEQFSGFLNKTGWQAIWSVNFAQGSLDEAIEEARAVASILGLRLLALELGNEVENYGGGGRPFRKAPYSYEAYRDEYTVWRAAILKAVPGVRFAAPDTAGSVEWVERMAKDAHGDVQLLTTHYYRGNQRQGNAEKLLHPDPCLLNVLERLRVAGAASGIPWRMCETNSYSGGGLPGVSDTFLGALWTLDFMLLLAVHGCAGVNIETGVNQLGFISSYSPIQDDRKGVNHAGVPYYGMLAFAAARRGCTQAMPVAVPESAAGVTAYGLGAGGKIHSAVLINRSEADISVKLTDLELTGMRALRLTAPSLSSTTGVTFGGAEIDQAGHWSGGTGELVGTEVPVRGLSAVVLRG